jgi:hypothetical protein
MFVVGEGGLWSFILAAVAGDPLSAPTRRLNMCCDGKVEGEGEAMRFENKRCTRSKLVVLSKCRQGKRYDDVRCEVRPSSTMTPFRLSEHFPADVFSSLLIFLLTANLSFESEPFSVEEIPIAWSLFAGRSQDERHVMRRLRCGGQGKSRL